MRRSIFLTVLMILSLCSVASVASEQMVDSVSYKLTEKTHDSDELLNAAQKLITLKANQPLDSSTLNESIDALYACRLFESIEVTEDKGHVMFLLKPAKYVRDIRVTGAHPLFADEVEVAMNTYPGDIFYHDVRKQQDSLIRELYLREGFVSPQVEITSETHRSGEGQVLNVMVEPGDYYRLNSIEINGNDAASNLGLKLRMRTWRASFFPGSGGRFLEADLNKDITTLTELYRANRYADVEIRKTVIMDSSDHSVNVVLDIIEGDRYRIEFSPRRDRGYRRGVFKDDITIFESGNRNNLGLRTSTRAIHRRMRESGFLDATVEYSDTTVERSRYNERIVYFDINRGPRTTVSQIILNGVNSIDKDLVYGQMLHVDRGRASRRAYNPDVLQEDVVAINMLYISRGFLNAQVSSDVEVENNSAVITINVDEGKQTILNDVTVDAQRFSEIDVNEAITAKKGDIFSSALLNQNARTLQALIAEQGYPHVEVTPVAQMSSDSTKADVDFRITEGPQVFMGDVRYIGAFQTQETVLNRELRASPGDPLSLQDIVDTQNRLRDLELFSSTRFRTIGLRERWDTVQVFVEVAEVPPYYGSFSTGFQSDEGPFISAKVGNRNMFGLNKDASISGELSQIGHRGELGLMEPRLFGTDLRAQFGVYGESISELNLDWTSTAYGISSVISYSIGRFTNLGLGTTYERRRLSTDDGEVPDTLNDFSRDNRPRNIVVLKPSFTYDRRDSFTRPRGGVLFGSSVDISQSIDSEVDDFVKIQSEARGYITPLSRLTLAGIIRGGYIHPLGEDAVVPTDQIFYLGGTQNIRGFDKNLFHPDSSGGTAMLSASIEARFELGYNIELTAFGDIGRLENDFRSISEDQFRSSAGLGLRYITPIGPIGLLYGHKIDRKPDESSGAFHFSLGYTF
ncbi:outer membrane protein assembly factor BamA [Chitinispirillales bacterium ANBcel5]|uniref:outer membrane protein assembly factor BamA n=1 Tax=Cellulosispirillum alkaliphilum TaxID=3039283 RepID=UPI002A54670E|nr:outer membrane protein assembly factor BamA [Chitinispirillales bacterium ANBcel5]